MGRRIDLHWIICLKLAELGRWPWNRNESAASPEDVSAHVYYQPPASLKLSYPCVLYKLEDMPAIHADNLPYHWDHVYQLTVIDRDPESKVREKIAELPTCRFVRSFVSDNLNHYIFRIYY